MRPSLHLLFLHAKQRLLVKNCKSLWVPDFAWWLYMRNSAISTRISNLLELVISRTPPSSVVFACKTATLWPELLVSIGARPHLWFFAFKTASLAPELQVSMRPSPHLWFCALTTATLWPEFIVSIGPRRQLTLCACKTTRLASEILVSICPSPHLSFCACKTRLWIWITNLYRSQTSPMVLWMQNSVISSRITSLHGSQTSAVGLCM